MVKCDPLNADEELPGICWSGLVKKMTRDSTYRNWGPRKALQTNKRARANDAGILLILSFAFEISEVSVTRFKANASNILWRSQN